MFEQLLCGSVSPVGTLVQVPRALGSAHDLQVPPQVVEQQTPCSQTLLRHSAPLTQTAPFGLRPQEPPMQEAGAEQSALVVHVALQAPVPQMYGKQEVAPGVTQVPAPSQLDIPVNRVVPVGQDAARQVVPAAYRWQAPPWQRPLRPHVSVVWVVHISAGSRAPVATLVQVPSEPLSAHDRHGPVHEVAQQIPCSQKLCMHSAAEEQEAPSGLVPQELPWHEFGGWHWELTVQAAKHLVPLQRYGLHGC
jgi:hypothetical protein